MAIKFRIGNLVVITSDQKSDKPKKAQDRELEALAANVDDLGDQIETKVKRWIANDRFFDGLRNTYARILLTILGALTLVWFGVLAFNDPNLTGWYIFALLLTVLAQQISVRYVFNASGDELVDEYQAARRDRAFRIAYKNIQGFIGWVIFLAIGSQFVSFSEDNGIQWAWDRAGFNWSEVTALTFNFTLDVNQVIVLVAALIAFLNLQKYWAWGIKGEPFRSKDEPNE